MNCRSIRSEKLVTHGEPSRNGFDDRSVFRTCSSWFAAGKLLFNGGQSSFDVAHTASHPLDTTTPTEKRSTAVHGDAIDVRIVVLIIVDRCSDRIDSSTDYNER